MAATMRSLRLQPGVARLLKLEEGACAAMKTRRNHKKIILKIKVTAFKKKLNVLYKISLLSKIDMLLNKDGTASPLLQKQFLIYRVIVATRY